MKMQDTYQLPVPADVTAAIQSLTAACRAWPLEPADMHQVHNSLPSRSPLPPASDQLAMTACYVATDQFSVAPALWLGGGCGVIVVLLLWLTWRFVCGTFTVVRSVVEVWQKGRVL